MSGMSWGWPARTDDLAQHPLFINGRLGFLSRWIWRFFSYRLTRAGHWFIWPTLLFALFGSTSLDIQAYVIFVYAGILWILAFLVAVLTAPRVTVHSTHAERICARETLPVDVVVLPLRRGLNIDLHLLPVRLPFGLRANPAEGVALPAGKPGNPIHARLGIYADRRGVYALQGYLIETDFPFGLFNAYRIHQQPRPLLVYPRFTPLAALSLPSGYRFNPGGVALRAHQGDSFELLGNREYQDGDNVRNIDWRATARMQTTIIREYSQEYFLRVGVVLDTFVPEEAREATYANFERAVSLCAAISDYMARQEYMVDIFAAGPNLYHLATGGNLTYLDEILDILACVQSNPEEPFTLLEPEISQTLGKITLIICVMLDWNDARQQFVDYLAMHGVAVKVVVVRDEACTLDPAVAPWAGGITVIAKTAFDTGVEVL